MPSPFRNLRIRAAIALIALLPTTGAVVSSGMIVADRWAVVQGMAALAGHAEVVARVSAFIHELQPSHLANVDGDGSYVRVQVLTNADALDRDKQLAVVARFTAIVATAAGDPTLAERTWVLLTQAPDGGWGLAGHAHTNQELIAAARAQLAQLHDTT